jgi:hypothetical protein
MKIHRYFFWIEDNFIEIYKDGKLERYDGEDRTYVKKLDDFWKKWESNSKIILSDEKIDFTFLIDEKIDKENLFNSIEKYATKRDLSSEFSSEDLKKILDSKNIKKVRFKYNDEELTIVKTEEKYIKAELDDDLIKISILGNNVNVDILKEISNQRVEKKEKKEYKTGRLSSFFRKKREEE